MSAGFGSHHESCRAGWQSRLPDLRQLPALQELPLPKPLCLWQHLLLLCEGLSIRLLAVCWKLHCLQASWVVALGGRTSCDASVLIVVRSCCPAVCR